MQHMLFNKTLGPLPHLDEIMVDDGSPKAMIDLGCGNGNWFDHHHHLNPGA